MSTIPSGHLARIVQQNANRMAREGVVKLRGNVLPPGVPEQPLQAAPCPLRAPLAAVRPPLAGGRISRLVGGRLTLMGTAA